MERLSVSLPVGTVTFLLTDVERSTFLWESVPEAMSAAIRRHYRLLDAAIARHGGARPREQGEGDSVVAVFRHASDAVAAALSIQRAFYAERWPPGAELRLRIAVHTGPAQLRDERNYFGPAVNRCARLRAIAHGGQVVLSRATRDLVVSRLPDGAELVDLGRHRLRDLGHPEHVFGLVHPELPANFPALCSLGTLSSNLPGEPTSFVGRSAELAELRALLGQVRLLTLTGTGGCGKTRLALQLAMAATRDALDGVWWVELGRLADSASVPAAVTAAVGLREVPGWGPRKTLLGYLQARRALLVLDNCEHVRAGGAELVTALLQACPSLTVLATSRAPLGVAGETTWRVPSMSLPADAHQQPVEVLRESDAVRLFADRATQAYPEFRLTEANAAAIARICRELDGIPLAIELAAARVRALQPEQIAHRLGDRFHFLTGTGDAVLPRQRTLRASLDWSFELLSEGERVLLRRLSVFSGGWTLQAAEQVCAGGDIDPASVRDLLAALVDQSLVTTLTQGKEVRYGMLEIVRQYASARLAEAGEACLVGQRHLTYYFGLAERAEPAVRRGERDDPALQRLAVELPNLRAALERSVAIDPETASRRFELLLALGDAQWWAGHTSEAGATFQSAAFLARRFKEPHRLAEAALRVGEVGYGGAYMQAWCYDPTRVELLDGALAALGEEQTPLKVRMMARLATSLYLSPFDSRARRHVLSRHAVTLARRLGDPPTLAYALHGRHLAVWGPDNLEERIGLSAEILQLAQRSGDFSLQAAGHVWRMADLFEAGHLSGADREVDAYEALARRVGYPHLIAYVNMFRATQAILRGHFADAEAFAQRSLALGEQVGDVNVRLSHHVQMALLRAVQGRPRETAASFEPVARELPPELAWTVQRGFLCLAGERDGVKDLFPHAWRALDRTPPSYWLHMAGATLTCLAAYAEAPRGSAAHYQLVRPYEGRWVLAGRDAVGPIGPLAYYLGLLAAALSRFDAAARHFETTIEAAERVGARPFLALAQGAYGALLARRGASLDRKRARQLLTQALQTAHKLGMNQLYDDVIAARALLPREPEPAPAPPALSDPGEPAAVFRCEGEYWTICFDQITIHLRDTKGLRYLRRLLSCPGRPFHVLNLVEGTTVSAHRARANVGQALRGCLTRIGLAHPALGAHLRMAVKTGSFCSYQPDTRARVRWRT
jgi:predicted ATPase/class 3 adenylate cyclase/tetratricopeptide (TPR) repeat protein